VVARVGGGEGEAAGGSASLGDDTVVVIEDFLDVIVLVVDIVTSLANDSLVLF
jgi:hypothetical protein